MLMKKTRLFRWRLTIENKADLETEKQLETQKLLVEQANHSLFGDYIKNCITHLRPEDFIPGYNGLQYDRITLCTEKTRTDILQAQQPILERCLDDLAKQGKEEGCEYIVNVTFMGYSGMTSKAPSGFMVSIGGSGFGFISPDGVYSESLRLIGTGLIRKK